MQCEGGPRVVQCACWASTHGILVCTQIQVIQIPKVVYYRTFYQLLFGPIESPLKTNAVFLKKQKSYLSFSPTSWISSACCNLISRNLPGAHPVLFYSKGQSPPVWAPPILPCLRPCWPSRGSTPSCVCSRLSIWSP